MKMQKKKLPDSISRQLEKFVKFVKKQFSNAKPALENLRNHLSTLQKQSARQKNIPIPAQDAPTPVRKRHMRYDRMILAALLLFLIVFLLISLIRCAAKGGKPDVQAANAPVVTTVVTTLSPEQLQQRHAVYPYAITVVGDSIASGFSLYGAIPEENGLAKGCVAIRNIHDFTFADSSGAEKDILEVLREKQPPYIYLSMGMNDINLLSAEEYTAQYASEIEKIQTICPDSDIIVAGITPILPSSDFTSNASIQQYNAALAQTIQQLNRENVAYFDAYAVISDPASGGLAEMYSAGDGVHLGNAAYPALLNALGPLLDAMSVPPAFPALEQRLTETTAAETAISGTE